MPTRGPPPGSRRSPSLPCRPGSFSPPRRIGAGTGAASRVMLPNRSDATSVATRPAGTPVVPFAPIRRPSFTLAPPGPDAASRTDHWIFPCAAPGRVLARAFTVGPRVSTIAVTLIRRVLPAASFAVSVTVCRPSGMAISVPRTVRVGPLSMRAVSEARPVRSSGTTRSRLPTIFASIFGTLPSTITVTDVVSSRPSGMRATHLRGDRAGAERARDARPGHHPAVRERPPQLGGRRRARGERDVLAGPRERRGGARRQGRRARVRPARREARRRRAVPGRVDRGDGQVVQPRRQRDVRRHRGSRRDRRDRPGDRRDGRAVARHLERHAAGRSTRGAPPGRRWCCPRRPSRPPGSGTPCPGPRPASTAAARRGPWPPTPLRPGATGGVTSRASGSVNAAPVALPTNTPSRITRYALEPGGGAPVEARRGARRVQRHRLGGRRAVRGGHQRVVDRGDVADPVVRARPRTGRRWSRRGPRRAPCRTRRRAPAARSG